MADKAATGTSRILFMSGDLDQARCRCSQLALAGWQTLQVGNHLEALSAVKRHDVDVVILCLPVDEMVDTDLPNVLRNVASTAYLPVIILAEDPAEEQRCRFLNSGADDILAHDISQAELVARIRALLRIKDLQDALSASRTALQNALRRERKLLTKLRRDNAHLQVLVTTDPLTHVQNVRSFRDILRHEFKIAKRYNQPLSLLMLDADHFKVINDSYGHPSGDYVLKELAVILKQSVRESDVVARIGGEEFAVILPRADAHQAAAFAERIRTEVFSRKFIVFDHEIHVTISIGSSTYPADAEITEPEMLVYFADQALLTAKESGRDCVVAFGEMDRAVRHRLRRQYLGSPFEAEDTLGGKQIPVQIAEDQPVDVPVT